MPAFSLLIAVALLGSTFYTSTFWLDLALALMALACLGLSIWAGRRGQLLLKLAVLAALPVVPITTWLEGLVVEQQLTDHQAELRDELNDIAQNLESQLVLNRSYLDAVVLLTSNIEDFSQTTYHGWLTYLVPAQNYTYLNIAITDDYVITNVYPESDDNLALVGRDMRDVPEQRSAIETVMRDQLPVVVGPIETLQGDTALIYRLPVPSRPQMIISGVLSLDRLLTRAALAGANMNLQLTLVRDEQSHQLLSGGELGPRAVQAGFRHSGYDWQFRAEPEDGFYYSPAAPWGARAAGLVLWGFWR